ncbi:MAG: acetoacetate--CoA ligase [Actinomycetota bacterium]|nr:acetoacetate--CoA ligase [Actinomycetota bacterium]
MRLSQRQGRHKLPSFLGPYTDAAARFCSNQDGGYREQRIFDLGGIVSQPLWTPTAARRESTNLWAFAEQVGVSLGAGSYDDLHRWSIQESGEFWRAVWNFAEGIGDLGNVDFEKGAGSSSRFFPDASINLAENYLKRSDDEIAISYRGENVVERDLSFGELRGAVGRVQRALQSEGVQSGDRVATLLPNGPEAVIVFLAAASIGAIYSSTSPDFGSAGVLDRFGQITPKILVATDCYFYSGVRHDITNKVVEVANGLPSLQRLVMVGYGDRELDISLVPNSVGFDEWTSGSLNVEPVFVRSSFDHPIYVLYSSGTTGKPKCIVHRAGGVLLKHWSEQLLHCDLRAGDRLMYFTTTGWMMWNWLVAGLACDVSLVLYDGSPFHPGPSRLFDIADELGPRLFGVSAKYIEATMKEGLRPRDTHTLASVETVTSTGSPLAPEGFDWVYQNLKSDVHLASFSGGTDICGCFVIGDPTGPVHRGEIQVPALGMDVAVFDDLGNRLSEGEQGELVCCNAFPSMPLEFWDDPEGIKYHDAYFARFPGVWHHGDFAEWSSDGGMIISGRSDATLNPGGVRIGTAEIYRQVDLIDEVLESIVIGQQIESDTRVVLFVRLREGLDLDDELTQRIRAQIRLGASPRHVPAVVAQVPSIPRTRSGKLVELAVRDAVHGRLVTNVEAIDDPEALNYFRDHPALA